MADEVSSQRSSAQRGPDAPPRGRRLPLQLVVIAPFLLPLLVAVGLVAWISIKNTRGAVDSVISQLRSEATERVIGYVEAYLETPQRINALNADALRLGQLDPNDSAALSRHFWHQLQEFGSVGFIFFGSVDGGAAGAGRYGNDQLVVDTTDVDLERGLIAGMRYEYLATEDGRRGELLRSNPGFDSRRRPWFAAASDARGPVWGEPYTYFAVEQLAFAASRPVYGDEGELIGVFGAEFALDQISEFLRTIDVSPGAEVFIVEPSGLLIAASTQEGAVRKDSGLGTSDPAQRLDARDSANPLIRATVDFLSGRLGGLSSIGREQRLTFEVDGERQFIQVAPVARDLDIDWLVVTIIPAADFTAGVEATTRSTLALSLGALALAILLGLAASRWITTPILRLNRASQEIASGRLDQELEIPPIDQLGDLARSFNSMATQLQGSFDELEGRVADRTRELRRAKESADSANRAKSDFLANISHDIRTPLAAILGYVELLNDPNRTPEETNSSLRTIRAHGRHLNQLVGDLLDISRIESGHLEVHLQPYELGELLAQIAAELGPRANDRRLEFEIETDDWLPWRFDTDSLRLRQILSNLLDNAFKYTERGGVRLRVSRADDKPPSGTMADQARLRFEVIDTGPGIDRAGQERLFRRFTRLEPVDESRSADPEQSGFGLGLSIVHQLTELMGGRVDVDSQPGRGSTFVVELPLTGCAGWAHRGFVRRPLSEALGPAQQPRLSGRVLIVDDSAALQDLCARMLGRWGLDCATADDGRQAVDRASNDRFDAILMDWQMPNMNGLEAVRELRRRGSTLPIIALTAAAAGGDREAGMAAGCDAYLVKPIDFRELHRLLSRVLIPANESTTHTVGRRGGDTALEDLAKRYAEGLVETVSKLETLATVKGWNEIRAIAHRVAGTAGSYRLSEIFDAAAELETIVEGRSDGDAEVHDRVTRSLASMRIAVNRAIDSLS